MYFGLMDVILVDSGQKHVSANLQGAEKENTKAIKTCLNHLTVPK